MVANHNRVYLINSDYEKSGSILYLAYQSGYKITSVKKKCGKWKRETATIHKLVIHLVVVAIYNLPDLTVLIILNWSIFHRIVLNINRYVI